MKQLLFLLFLSTTAFSQTAIVSGGGTISNGSISYSIGQVFVNQISNSTESVSLGIQQPFEALVLNLDEFDSKIKYLAYPNPTNGFFNLQLKNTSSFPYQLKLYDITGRIVLNQIINNNNTQINISSIAKGFYSLQLIKTGKQVYSFKILKN